MKKKNLFIILTTLILCLSFMKPSAWAGNVQRNRWEGVAIGIGAAILGNALINHYRYSVSTQSAVNQRHLRTPHYGHRYRQKPSGHWEERKVWVQPVYKRVWKRCYLLLFFKFRGLLLIGWSRKIRGPEAPLFSVNGCPAILVAAGDDDGDVRGVRVVRGDIESVSIRSRTRPGDIHLLCLLAAGREKAYGYNGPY